MNFRGFGFSGYRSIGSELAKIAPLRKINLIIGQNNSGKSNIITYLKDHFSNTVNAINGGNKTRFSVIDRHISSQPVKYRISFPIDTNTSDYSNYVDNIVSSISQNGAAFKHYIDKILKSKYFLDEDGLIWFVYESPDINGQYNLNLDISKIKPILGYQEWNNLWNALTNQSGGGLDQHWIPETIRHLIRTPPVPNIHLIPAIRKIGESGTSPDDYSGIGIIERIARLQNPPLDKQELKSKFNDINQFVRTVLENDKVTLEIPFDRDMILVHMNNKTLPLTSLGTGIHEVIILAAAATLLDNSVLCVEEPELHLHPLLQKKLIKYLSDSTSNQYIFTTHSAHLLDTVGAEIFHVTNYSGKTVVSSIASTKEKSCICHDLGYKASDILQANCIIWVEGPSDRLYINNWLRHVDQYLIEGVHYAIMFYGGRLFSHISANDIDDSADNIDDFISVRKLNRNTCIVFDSDKRSSKAKLSPTKIRLKEEFDEGPGFAWITKGREIENYIDPDIIENCVKFVHPSANTISNKGQWHNTLKYTKHKSKDEIVASKVKVAKYYVDNCTVSLDVLDLRQKILQLRKFIYTSNGFK